MSGDITSSVAQPATVRLFVNGELAGTQPVNLEAGTNRRHVQRSRPRTPGSCASGWSSRRPATRSTRTTAPRRTRSSRASPGCWSSRATRPSRPSSSRRSRPSARSSTRSSPRRLPVGPRRARRLRLDRARRRARGCGSPTRRWRRSRSTCATSGGGSSWSAGRAAYGAGGYTDTPLEETLPVDMGVRDREKQPDVALVVVIDKSGSMDACHCNSFNGGMGGGSRHRRACARSTSARRRSCGRPRP